MRYERSDSGLRGWRVLVDANEVRVASGKTVPYSTWIGFIEEGGRIHVWTPAAYVPRGYRAAAREMLERAKVELLGSRDNPRRPPKQWMRDCVAGASRSAADAGAVCGALWYRKMSPAAKRAALAREGRAENPLRPYYTVKIPYTATARTKWHPTERSGPFSTLSRGVFSTKEDAHAWARKHLGNTRYNVLRVTERDVVEVRNNPSWAKVFG